MASDGAPTAPVTFGRYALLERLAVGGMAEVFRAKITSSHGFEKILVVKRILPHLAADPGFVAMFIDEAKLTAQLTHPKIVQILDFGDVDGQFFTALEFVDGFDALGLLRTAAQKRVRIPAPLAVFIAQELLEALDYAHNARDMEGKPMQIVHRDISPSNIFMSKRGDVKLGDFGIAHAVRRDAKTQAGPIDARSDLFAVGVVLAELLTGRRLFSAAADLDVLLKVRDVRLDRLDKYGADLPPALDRIVRAALKKDPAERPQTASAFRDQLADYLFAAGERIGPAELRAFTAKLLGADPDTAAQLLRAARQADRPGRGGEGERAAGPPAGAPDEVDRSSARAFTPVSRPGEAPRAGGRRPGAASGVGSFVSAAPARPPDSAGDLSVITPMRLFADLALASETGLIRFERPDTAKEIFLVAGAPESVSSGDPSERFGEYLVARSVLAPPDLELALGMLPHYNGKLGDTLVALGMLRPLDVFRLLSEQVRDRVIGVFGWTEGTFAFHRGVVNRQESFPLGLDTFEMLGAGVVSLPAGLLEARFAPLAELRPIPAPRPRFDPELFKIGPTPATVLGMLDGQRTLQRWLDSFEDPDERLTFLRTLYLLVETDLVQLD
jgi:hypothetical protein